MAAEVVRFCRERDISLIAFKYVCVFRRSPMHSTSPTHPPVVLRGGGPESTLIMCLPSGWMGSADKILCEKMTPFVEAIPSMHEPMPLVVPVRAPAHGRVQGHCFGLGCRALLVRSPSSLEDTRR